MSLADPLYVINLKQVYPGVKFLHPTTTIVEKGVCLGKGTVVAGHVSLLGKTSIGKNTRVYTGATVTDSKLGDHCVVGQYALIRDQARLLGKNTVGPHCEVARSTFHQGARAFHKVVVLDAVVGANALLGAGVTTANTKHDGVRHLTKIGANTKVGVNVVFVAPVTIGENCWVAAGSVVTKNVPNKHITFARAKQVNLPKEQKP